MNYLVFKVLDGEHGPIWVYNGTHTTLASARSAMRIYQGYGHRVVIVEEPPGSGVSIAAIVKREAAIDYHLI